MCDVPLKVAVHTHHGFTAQDEDVIGIGRILSKIPKLEVIDMPSIAEIGRHCSDATVKAVGREKYFGLMSAWIAEAKKRGADRIVSVYHSCHRHLVMAQLEIPADQRIPTVMARLPVRRTVLVAATFSTAITAVFSPPSWKARGWRIICRN